MTSVINYNQNFLAGQKFSVVIPKFEGLSFYAQRVIVPAFSSSFIKVPTATPYDFYDHGDKLEQEDFTINFILDEDLIVWKEMLYWIKNKLDTETNVSDNVSDITIFTTDNHYVANKKIKLYNALPTFLSGFGLDVDTSEDSPLTADVNFKYTSFIID